LGWGVGTEPTHTESTAACLEPGNLAPPGPDEVHVWTASLDQPDAVVARLRTLLDDSERERADRFSFEKGRRHFTVGRGLLRRILGEYLGLDPGGVRFCYNPYGKPALAGEPEPGEDALRFNVSHSGSLVLYAVTRGREVGVDLETIRPEFAGEPIAERFFSPGEVAALRAVAPEARIRAFFDCWTRKEAYIKARGKGLSLPLDSFEVSLAPGAPPALLATHDDPAEARRWSLFGLEPGPGYVGALVVAGPSCRLRLGTWIEAAGWNQGR
jgi:4'-phosphopantetheinyl transferase